MNRVTCTFLIISILHAACWSFSLKEYTATTAYRYIRKASASENGNYIWKIKASSSYRASSYYLEMYWLKFNVNGSMPDCAQDFVEVLLTGSYKSIGKFCSNNTSGYWMKYMFVVDGHAMIRYQSNHNADLYLKYRLRNRIYSYYGSSSNPYCYNTNNILGSGILYSSGYPKAYKASSRSCYHKISTADGKETRLVLMDLNLNYYICASYDYIEIRGSDSSSSTFSTSSSIAKKFCGAKGLVFVTRKRYIHLRFRRIKGSTTRRGFMLSYISYDINQPRFLPGTCTFERDNCGFVEDVSDHFNWRRHRGLTSSQATGPTLDHTMKTSLGYYMYIEASNPRKKGEISRISKSFSGLKSQGNCLRFWYHMYGSAIGRLNIYLRENLSSPLSVPSWSVSENQNDTWLKARVNVDRNRPVVTFEGIIGSGYKGDIAIDDIFVENGPCLHTGINHGFIIRHYGRLCLAHSSGDSLILTRSCSDTFMFTDDGALLHINSGKCAVPVLTSSNSQIRLQNNCGSPNSWFAQTSSKSLKHMQTGKCVHPLNSSSNPVVGTPVVIYSGCDELRLRFEFVQVIPTTKITTTVPPRTSTTNKITDVSTGRPTTTTIGTTSMKPSTRREVTTLKTTERAATNMVRTTIFQTTENIIRLETTASTTTNPGNVDRLGADKSNNKADNLPNTIVIVFGVLIGLTLILLATYLIVRLKRRGRNEEVNVLNNVTPPHSKASNIYVRDQTSTFMQHASSVPRDGRSPGRELSLQSTVERPLPAIPPADAFFGREMELPYLKTNRSLSEAELLHSMRKQSLFIPNSFSELDAAGLVIDNTRAILRKQSTVDLPHIEEVNAHINEEYIEMKVHSEPTAKAEEPMEEEYLDLATAQDQMKDHQSHGIYEEIAPTIVDHIITQNRKSRSISFDNSLKDKTPLRLKNRSLTIDEHMFSSGSPFLGSSSPTLPPVIKSFEKPSESAILVPPSQAAFGNVGAGGRKISAPAIISSLISPILENRHCLKEVEEEDHYLAPHEIKGPSNLPESSKELKVGIPGCRLRAGSGESFLHDDCDDTVERQRVMAIKGAPCQGLSEV